MKTRIGFVSNSSSTSFTIYYKTDLPLLINENAHEFLPGVFRTSITDYGDTDEDDCLRLTEIKNELKKNNITYYVESE
jgi:hypothetical protein